MRVLITTPRLNGGVANYFTVIRNYLSVDAQFLEIGALKQRETILEKIRHLYYDRRRLNELLSGHLAKYDIIHINPSFVYGSLVRDGLLLNIAKRRGKKTLVFFRGWDKKYAKIVHKYFFRPFFSTYEKADAFVVLASEFKAQLRSWGLNQPIYLETTLVDDALLSDFSLENRLKGIRSDRTIRLLFLARIEKEKGICETIEAAKLLSERHPNLRLFVAGDGPFLDDARQFTKRADMTDKVSFVGYVRGGAKKAIYIESDIYILPTYHGEGMPNAVLEAMAFGLPVVTRPVGALKDFFTNGQHGFMTESKNPIVIASLIEKIICNKDLWKIIVITAHEYAMERFLASKVAARLEEIYNNTSGPESLST